MQALACIRAAVPIGLLLAVSAAIARADVQIEISSSVPDAQGKIAVDVILHGGGDEIGGFQNDIVFDNTAIRLDSVADCVISPAISAFPLGLGSGVTTCSDDPTIGPCKTLVLSLTTCAEEMGPPRGCLSDDPTYSRLRAIVAAIEVANTNSIPDGVAYSCTFTVVDPARLPVQLFSTNIVVANQSGRRLASGGGHGNVCVDEEGSRRCAAPRKIDEQCAIDFECAFGNCNVCCDHPFNGICAAPRTPTPTATRVPTRTRAPTRTATIPDTPTASPTYTVTNTPTPKSIGDPCARVEECAANLSCNFPARVCCTSSRCPEGMACNVPGFEGYCVRGMTPTPTPALAVVIEVGSATPGADGFANVVVSMRFDGGAVNGMQNDILFDNTIVSLDSEDCTIATAIGLFPLGTEATSCFDDPSIGPCKNQYKTIQQCGSDPAPVICPQGAGPNISVARNIIAGVAVPNSNPIPSGPLYTCRFKVIDPTRLPVELGNQNVVVSSVANSGPRATGISGRITAPAALPGSNGTDCSSADECDGRNCIDGVCCSQRSCDAGESCSVSGSRGDCAPKRLQGEGCNLGTDCASGDCDLHRDSAASIFRGNCGAPHASSPQSGECTRGNECDSGNCVDGFCCAADRCSSGQFCNTGECARPAEPGAPCTSDEQCALGLCVDGACCVTGSCPDGMSCGVPTRKGICREPFRLGSACSLDEQCPTGFCTDGTCCEERDCPLRSRCNLFPDEGVCSPINKPSLFQGNGPTFDQSYIDIGEDIVRADGTAHITVVLVTNGARSTTRNDIIFDNTIVQLRPDSCVINPRNSLYPPAAAPSSCFDDPTFEPCKELTGTIFACGADPQPSGCPFGAGSEISVYRGVVDAVQVPNSNPVLRNAVLYTCPFRVIDRSRLPTRLVSGAIAVQPADSFGFFRGFDGSICSGGESDASCAAAYVADGDSCSSDVDCLPGHCDMGELSSARGLCALPAGVPTAGVSPTRTSIPPATTPSPTLPSQPTASATASANPLGGDDDDGCNMAPRGSSDAPLWPVGLLALLLYARRRAAAGRPAIRIWRCRHCS